MQYVNKGLGKFRDVLPRRFGSEGGHNIKASKMYNFEVKHNQKAPNDVKWDSLRDGHIDFSEIFDLTLKYVLK